MTERLVLLSQLEGLNPLNPTAPVGKSTGLYFKDILVRAAIKKQRISSIDTGQTNFACWTAYGDYCGYALPACARVVPRRACLSPTNLDRRTRT